MGCFNHVPRPHQSHQQLENGPPHTKNLTSPRADPRGSPPPRSVGDITYLGSATHAVHGNVEATKTLTGYCGNTLPKAKHGRLQPRRPRPSRTQTRYKTTQDSRLPNPGRHTPKSYCSDWLNSPTLKTYVTDLKAYLTDPPSRWKYASNQNSTGYHAHYSPHRRPHRRLQPNTPRQHPTQTRYQTLATTLRAGVAPTG